MRILDSINELKKDAILWQCAHWLELAGTDAHKKGKAIDSISALLAQVPNEAVRQIYLENITKEHKLPKKTVQTSFEKVLNAREDNAEVDEDTYLSKLPKWMDKEEIMNEGFCSVNKDGRVGYYSWSGTGKTEITNFTITPIFHVLDIDNSRHIFEAFNGKKRAVFDMPSKVLIAPESMQGLLVGKPGPFMVYGTSAQWKRVMTKVLYDFPSCREISQLGWQPEGFFAYVNKIYIPNEQGGEGEWKDITQWGIVEVKGEHYLVPAASAIYKDLRGAQDRYKSDRVLQYIKAPIDFNTWMQLMYTVYKEKGLFGIAYVLLTAFRDIAFKIDHNFPHLYAFGERSSGKSKFLESLSEVFSFKRSAFHLSSGTDAAFFSYVGDFCDILSILNEFDIKEIRPGWFQDIKGFFEGEGRQRKRMDGSKKNETMTAETAIALAGQFLNTEDDNSIVSRSCILDFHEKSYTDDERKAYDDLKQYESHGLTSFTADIISHRAMVEEHYYHSFNENLGAWRRATTEQFNQRIFQNWCHIATIFLLFKEVFKLPVSALEFNEMCYQQALKWSKFIRSTDVLSDFWNTVVFLLETGELVEGWDFKIESATEIRVRSSKKDEPEQIKKFETPKKVLYLRLSNVHAKYEIVYRQRSGEKAYSLNNILTYCSNRDYFLGATKQKQFKRAIFKDDILEVHGQNDHINTGRKIEETITSAFMFDYDLLDCDLERKRSDGNATPPEPALFT